jgi:xylulokinase
MRLYLGLDCSTQSLTAMAIAIDGGRREVVWEGSLEFDRDLPDYRTRHGVLPSADPLVAVSPPLMWAEALDAVLADLAASGLDPTRLTAIAGSAQQHGSVYLNQSSTACLANLDPARPLADQLRRIFTRETAPIWMDASTSAECAEIAAAVGGAARLAGITGSRAFERFTGPQIRRVAKQHPDAYAATTRIDLVSSFMASLLAGRHAPLDPGDASGMNLMDLHTRCWSREALDATAPDLEPKLPPIAPATTVIGTLSPYWQTRHRLSPAALVVWTGDNPSSLAGTGIVEEGQVAVSLGTSDTIFGLMHTPHVDPGGAGHVFGAPTGEYMGLTCLRNGSLARERIRDAHGLDWRGFSRALETTSPGQDGALMLPWFEPEITPTVNAPAVHRRNLDAGAPHANVRALVEAQMMALANHSRWMGIDVRTIHVTGGASANRAILRVMADVFGADVFQFQVGNAACLGAALRAWHADEAARGSTRPWSDIVAGLAEPIAASRIQPDGDAVRIYAALRAEYARFEADVLSRR